MLRTIKKVRQFASSPVRQLKARDFVLCLTSALMLAFSFPSLNLWLLAWVGFIPLFYALQNKNLLQSLILGFITGIIFWWLTIYWLVHVTFIGTFILVLYLSLYFAFFALFYKFYELRVILRQAQDASPKDAERSRSASYELLVIPSVWVLLEYVRSYALTGFPWALLGYSQYLNLAAIQLSDITGSYGVSFLLIMSNTIIWRVIKSRGIQTKRFLFAEIGIAVFIVVACISYGFYRLNSLSVLKSNNVLRVAVIQGNIPQELKWDPRSRNPIILKYLLFSKSAITQKPDLIVWPEASLPEIVTEDAQPLTRIREFASQNRIPLLIGAVTFRNNFYYNSALLLSDKGEEVGRYDKVHLVPFGEYIPLKKLFPFLQVIVPIGDINRGYDYTVFKLPKKAAFSVLICFEDLFPGISRRFIGEGADFLVTITNDAWYKKTSAAEQHFQASVLRSVENRAFMVRAANTGISGFISPSGKIISLVKDSRGEGLFVDGFKAEDIIITRQRPSFYTRFGDLFALSCALICFYGTIRSIRKGFRFF